MAGLFNRDVGADEYGVASPEYTQSAYQGFNTGGTDWGALMQTMLAGASKGMKASGAINPILTPLSPGSNPTVATEAPPINFQTVLQLLQGLQKMKN